MATVCRTSHLGFRSVQKTPTIHPSSGFIRGMPVDAACPDDSVCLDGMVKIGHTSYIKRAQTA
jgi:hypothetical protein